MRHHIERIRQKPEHIRKRIALYSSVSVTAFIFVFWLAARLGPVTTSEQAVAALEDPYAAQAPASPIRTMQASLTEAVGQFWGAIENGKPPESVPLQVKPMQ